MYEWKRARMEDGWMIMVLINDETGKVPPLTMITELVSEGGSIKVHKIIKYYKVVLEYRTKALISK
jgi:hypothetical protein